ncbi:hypothetical protein D3P96_08255 [Weissella viridescens]|uniref:Uncharacterized protein n=1 Tax=Weissella viridescens TaxID=1629 RepID=A0A3P2RA94_WEIVI|nr:hypothetical protein [Weissella viridescens]RRG17354.1 hypothetical protein D3P96_08255 [Weissella viridescens]
MSVIKTYKYFGIDHLLVNVKNDAFVFTLLNEAGLEETFFANPWTLPSHIPKLLDDMCVESISYDASSIYPTVNFEQMNPKGFEEQAIVIQVWHSYREKIRRKAVVGSSVITDGTFDGH